MGVSNFLLSSKELLRLRVAQNCTMSDEEYYEEEEVTSQTSKKGEGFIKAKKQKGELDEQLREYINEWRKQRGKEEEIEEAQGETSQAQGDQSRAREEIGSTKEGRGGEAPQGRGRKEGQGG